MAHPKRVINFALFFYALFNSATNGCGISSTRTNRDIAGQIRTALFTRPNIGKSTQSSPLNSQQFDPC